MQFNFKILNKIDDLILTTYKQLVEQDRKSQKQEEKKQEEGEQKKEQSHMLHLIFLAFKTKFNAKFNLETNEGFQNNFLSLIGDKSVQGGLQTVPLEVMPPLKQVPEKLQELKAKGIEQEEIDAAMQMVDEVFTEMADALKVEELLRDMMEYVNDNLEDGEEEIDKWSDSSNFVLEFGRFIIESLKEKVELIFFFKNCFFSLEFFIKDLKETIVAICQVLSAAGVGGDAEEEEDNE